MRRQQRHRQHQPSQAPLPSVFLHQVAVACAVRAADLEDLPLVVGQIERREQIGQQIIDADRLRFRADPPGADHHGQPLDERPDHFERNAAGSDHDRRAELDDRHAARSERLAGFETALEMLAQRAIVVREPAQVDDATHARTPCRVAKRPRGCDIGFLIVAVGTHRVHEVIRRVDASQCGTERSRVEQIGRHDFRRRRRARTQHIRPARQTPDGAPRRFERGQQPAADVPGGAGEQDPIGAFHSPMVPVCSRER